MVFLIEREEGVRMREGINHLSASLNTVEL